MNPTENEIETFIVRPRLQIGLQSMMPYKSSDALMSRLYRYRVRHETMQSPSFGTRPFQCVGPSPLRQAPLGKSGESPLKNAERTVLYAAVVCYVRIVLSFPGLGDCEWIKRGWSFPERGREGGNRKGTPVNGGSVRARITTINKMSTSIHIAHNEK